MGKSELFKEKVAWITGASSGIGEALVYEFIKLDTSVIASSNDPAGLERVKAACGEKSVNVRCVPFDLLETAGICCLTGRRLFLCARMKTGQY